MEEEGNLKKDVDNNHTEGVKYKDLEYLKERGGPFTTAEEVKKFDLNNDLQSNEYVENLCQYLGDARNKTVLTSDDLFLVLDFLITNHENQVPAQTEDQTSDETNMPTDEQQTTDTVEYSLDEHIVAVWVDKKDN